MSTTSRYESLLPGIRTYVHAAWMSGKPTTLFGAAEALGELREGRRGQSATTPIFTAFDQLEAQGIAVRDPALSGRKSRVLVAWNWTGRSLEEQSLRHAVEGFLSAPVVATPSSSEPIETVLSDGRMRRLQPIRQSDRELVISAVRAVVRARWGDSACGPTGAKGYPLLLANCERIHARELRGLPTEAKKAGTRSSGERFVTAINMLCRYAAHHDLVALFVVPPQHAHPWYDWAVGCELTSFQRVILYALYDWLRGAKGNAVAATPDGVSIEDANEALDCLSTKKGGVRRATELKAVLTALGMEGRGPFARLRSESSLVRVDGRHFAPRWVLGAGNENGTQSWATTTALLEERGFGAQWTTFYSWYAKYSMLPSDALRAELGADIERAEIRLLKPATSRQRHSALRVCLGVATEILGIAPAECTPAEVFGARFSELLTALRGAWERRVDEQERLAALRLPCPGHPVSRESPHLARTILNAGLIAEALMQWGRSSAAAGAPIAPPETCEAWAASYRRAYREVREHWGDDEMIYARSSPTEKDVAAIQGDVSSLALVARSNRRAIAAIASSPGSLETAHQVQRALLGAIVATGAVRIGELGSLTYAADYKERKAQAAGKSLTRYLLISERLRKSGTTHEVALIEELVPWALWIWHRDHGRKLQMAPWLRDGRVPHDAIFCSPEHGGPVGWAADKPTDDEVAVREYAGRATTNASASLARQYVHWRRAELAAHPEFEVMTGARGHHGPHGARNHITFLAAKVGCTDRLAYLLGHKRKRTPSETLYGVSLAELNAETLRIILAEAPWLRGAQSADVDAPATILGRRNRSRQEQFQAERDAHLGREFRFLARQVNELSPVALQRRVSEIASKHGMEGGEAFPGPPA